MKTINLKSIRVGAYLIMASLMSVISASAQINTKGADLPKTSESKVTIREGQVIQLSFSAFEKRGINVINPTDLTGDIDLVAIDSDNNEIDRSVVILEPSSRATFDPWLLFEDVKSEQIYGVKVLVSLRPRDAFAHEAYSVSAAFFSQINTAWAKDIMAPSSYTIKNSGCAMTSAAMLLAGRMTNLTPKTLNAHLSKSSVGGYSSSGVLNWDKIPKFQPSSGVVYVGSSVKINGTTISSVKNAASLKSLLDGGYYVIATSSRYTSHFVAIYKYNGTGSKLSDFEYLDPADSNMVQRKVDDGLVTASSGIRLFK